jgi:hypothetical protein
MGLWQVARRLNSDISPMHSSSAICAHQVFDHSFKFVQFNTVRAAHIFGRSGNPLRHKKTSPPYELTETTKVCAGERRAQVLEHRTECETGINSPIVRLHVLLGEGWRCGTDPPLKAAYALHQPLPGTKAFESSIYSSAPTSFGNTHSRICS